MCEDQKNPETRAKLELADVFRACAERLPELTEAESRVVRDVMSCRTADLGGHVSECGECGHVEVSYNSCRNRHCPKCQSLEQARWLDDQQAALLPVQYHHVVFTVPDALNSLFLGNRKLTYNLLFAAVSETLQEVAANPRHLGAAIGFTAVLHTWTQTLLYHPHVHCIVAGGGLDKEENRWRSCRPGFFLPVRVLSAVFRGKFLSKLENSVREGTLRQADSETPSLLRSAAQKNWVVYSKPPVAGAEQVLRYLGRYTHRIAISNSRLISIENRYVAFAYKDRANQGQRKTMTLDLIQFTRRFLLHVLPHAYVRIRHFGFLANGVRRKKIELCRQLLGAEQITPDAPPRRVETWQELLLRLTGQDITLCPACRVGRLVAKAILPPQSDGQQPSEKSASP